MKEKIIKGEKEIKNREEITKIKENKLAKLEEELIKKEEKAKWKEEEEEKKKTK